ncbi:ABC transporter substrate-binding protein [Rhodococcus rhodochrous]|uniref:ABC transporter substrate-binding protein n=1 Tax=Rhodococcus rhodochrous TaxID=1829 RepID=UPI0002E93B62|nr:ABC transporter substrate-binding protein [Rhodococcus rhodochrous]
MSRRSLASVVAAFATALLLAGCGTSAATDATTEIDPQATLRYATTYGASSFDPHKTRITSDSTMLNLVYDRLVHRDRNADPVPGLAESWEFSEDGSTLTLNLRQDVTFADGTPLDAPAVVANLRRALEPDSITAAMLAGVESVEAVDAHTVALRLNGPGGQLVLTLSDLPGMIVNPNAFGTPDKDAALVLDPAGAGRYTVVQSQPGAQYRFAARDDYWDREAVQAEGFEWVVMTDPQTRVNAVASDQLDAAMATPMSLDPAEQQGLQTHVQTSLNNYVLNLNRTRSEFGKLEVRQALAHAVDRESVVETALEGHGEPASQNFPAGYFAHNEALDGQYAFDPDKAKQLLDEAGVPDGFAFVAGVSNLPENQMIGQILQEQLARVGITMEIRSMTPTDLNPAFNRGELDAILTTLVGRADPSLLLTSFYGQDSPQNPSRDAIPGFREAMEAANRATDPEERSVLLGEVNAVVMNYAAMLPIAFAELGAVASDRLSGYEPNRVVDEWRGVGVAAP